MKNLGMKIALAIAVIIIGILAYKVWIQKPGIVYAKQNDVIDKLQTEAKQIAESVDQKGYQKTVLERKADIIGNGNIDELPVSAAVLDSLRLDNLDKGKKLQQASLLNATLTAKALKAVKSMDSLLKEKYTYNDDFVTAVFWPDSTGGRFDVNYRISLIRHDYKKRKNWLSGYTNYTDILSPDKRISINNLQSITIATQKPKPYGLGIQAGYSFNPATGKVSPSIGVGFSYNFIRF